jgi:hypothetical protein
MLLDSNFWFRDFGYDIRSYMQIEAFSAYQSAGERELIL